MPPFVHPIRRQGPLFFPKARRCAVRFEVGRVGSLSCRLAFHHPDEDAFVAPPLQAIVERLRRVRFPPRISPPQPIAVDEDDLTQNASMINALAAMALRKIGPKTLHRLVRQPE